MVGQAPERTPCDSGWPSQSAEPQREGLDARAAAHDHLRATIGHRVQGGVALEDADRVVSREDGDRRAEADVRGARGERGEDHVGRRDRKLLGVMLTDAEEVHPQPVGQRGLLDDVADGLAVGDPPALHVGGTSPNVLSPIITVVGSAGPTLGLVVDGGAAAGIRDSLPQTGWVSPRTSARAAVCWARRSPPRARIRTITGALSAPIRRVATTSASSSASRAAMRLRT